MSKLQKMLEMSEMSEISKMLKMLKISKLKNAKNAKMAKEINFRNATGRKIILKNQTRQNKTKWENGKLQRV